MLQFLRRNQRIFFILITVIVVITFSFFGTYQTISSAPVNDSKLAFTTANGDKVSQYFLRQMRTFLMTDAQDRVFFNSPWGFNFLNDGVLDRNFFETGMATILVQDFLPGLETDLNQRITKERSYKPYSHPQIKYLSAEMAWKFFAPRLKGSLDKLLISQNDLDQELFDARVQLYLEQKKFTPETLRQVLHYQESQNSWVSPDPNLPHQDLALFRYHNIEDWFGPRFMELVCQFILNTASYAKKEGFRVPPAEAKADMLRLAEIQFQKQKESLARYSVTNSEQYLRDNLQRMGVEESVAVEIWQNVMLFRRYFEEVGHGVFESPLSYQAFDAFAGESLEVKQYQLPQDFQFSTFKTLQRFETYLAYSALKEKNPLALPKQFLAAEDVRKKAPGLVQQRYLINVKQISKHQLEAKLSVKETWAWELEDKNWGTLTKEFPLLLASSEGKTQAERHKALESLSETVRHEVDDFARAQIVDTHPEWLISALEEASSKKIEITLSQYAEPPLAGLSQPEKLWEALNETDDTKRRENLALFTTNNVEYFEIELIKKSDLEVMTFAEVPTPVLDGLLMQDLEKHYLSLQAKDPKKYEIKEGELKPLTAVETEIAESLFKDTINAVASYMVNVEGYSREDDLSPAFIGDFSASHRFFAYVVEQRKSVLKEKQNDPTVVAKEDTLSTRIPLAQQWQIEQKEEIYTRSSRNLTGDTLELFSLDAGSWSRVFGPSTGDITFFHVQAKKAGPYDDVKERIVKGQQLLSNEAQQLLMVDVINYLKDKQAIGFDVMETQETVIKET